MAKNLRTYQTTINNNTKAFLADSTKQRGQVYAPTGAGKTEMFIDLINHVISEQSSKNIAVIHPRLALSTDQLERFKGGVDGQVMYTSFHSGTAVRGYGDDIAEVATTVVSELQTIIDRANNILNRAHITFTTYNSYEKLVNAGVKFDLIVCDEAHYLVQDRFSKYLADMNADKILFYTATPIADRGDDYDNVGMLNFDLFGEVIGQVAPTELIPQGYIVAPLIHMLNCTTNRRCEKADIVDITAISYANQFAEVSAWGMKTHQMMVVARDVAVDIEENINTRIRELRDLITTKSEGKVSGDTVDVYCITADAPYKNGLPFAGTRQAAINEIKQSGANAIVVHYDTLSEGIDVSTLNGVLILRELAKSKLIQIIGRTARPDASDLDENREPKRELFNLEQGIDTRLKRRGLVTFPIVDGEWVCGTTARAVAEAFISGGYGDLLDYMPKTEFKPTGKEHIGTVIDEPTWLSKIIDVRLQRDLVDLDAFFDFGDEAKEVA